MNGAGLSESLPVLAIHAILVYNNFVELQSRLGGRMEEDMKKTFMKWTGLLLAASLLLTACGGGSEKENQPTLEATATPEADAGNDGETGDSTQGSGAAQGESAGESFSLSESVVASAKSTCDAASDMTKRAVRSEGNTRRLQQVFERMQNGEEVTVAYLGGSITEGYLVNSKQNYAYKTTAWLKKTFGNDSIKHVNAGLSGTSSTIGLLRVQKDVLDEAPDLVFIEFAVNDANDTTSKMMYESLVARVINSETAPAVVLIFTVLENGYTCEEHMSAVGEAYNLPMISVNAALAPELAAGTLAWSDYAQDEAHPTNQGHTYISEFIQYMFADIMTKQTIDDAMDYTACKKLGDAYSGMNFYNNKNLYIPDTGGFIEANSNIENFQSNWLWNKEAGESLKFTMTGKNLVLLYKEANSANMGAVEVYIDGDLKAKVNANSPSGWNNPQVALVLNDVTEAEHTVEIRVTEDTVDKDFHILGFGTTGTIHSEVRLNEEDIAYQERAIVNVGNTYNIQKLMERAEAGEELTIGFIGGSITQGTGASNANKCYAKLVYDWWCETYPQAKFNYVNAGIGATTSQFACARVQDDLLSYAPDFVIVEFSVNDDASGFFGETYESLINLILDEGGEDTAVMILNMVQYNNGINAQTVHNEVAKNYGIPAVSMKDSIYKEITFGRLEAADISSDMIHPNDRGHAYGAEIVTYFLQKVKDGIYHDDAPAVRPAASQKLVSATSKRYDSRNTEPKLNGFVKDEAKQNGITDIFKNGYTAKNTGDSITFENVYGSRISLQYRKTNSLGAPLAVAVIDGDEANAVTLDGNYPDGWGNWLYLHNIAEGLDATVPHTVEIRITEGTEKDFYLVSVIASGQEAEQTEE